MPDETKRKIGEDSVSAETQESAPEVKNSVSADADAGTPRKKMKTSKKVLIIVLVAAAAVAAYFALTYFDVFSTTIIKWSLPESFFRQITERTVAMAKKYGKESERWLMGYSERPEDFSQIDRVVDMYEELGVDRLGTWTYRGGLGTSVAAKDPIELWDNIGRNYRRVLKK